MKRMNQAAAGMMLLLVTFAGCGAKGHVPAKDDVAEALPEAGLVEAWSGGEEAGEEETTGPRVEQNDIYDENGVLCGYDRCEYDELDRITLEEQFDSEGNCTGRWERSYSDDGRECVTLIYTDGVFNSRMVTLFNERGVTTEQRLFDDRDTLLSVSLYDENGEPTVSEIYMGEAGAEQKLSEVRYGENGSVEERVFAPDGSLESVWSREFDENNREIRSLCYEGGIFRWDQRFSYDERSFCVRVEYWDESGTPVNYETMEYTPEGFLSIREEYTAANELTVRVVWEYADDGRILSIHHYDGEGQLREYTLMEYDERNRMNRQETFGPEDESLGHETYKYAEDGSYEVFSYFADNRLAGRKRYDAEGYLIERIDVS